MSTDLAAYLIPPAITAGPDVAFWVFLTVEIIVFWPIITINKPTIIPFHSTWMILTGLAVVLGHIELLFTILACSKAGPKWLF
jgi:hypothetical protein